MLISLLLNREGNLVAGGWASDQIPFGQNYWHAFLGLAARQATDCDTSVVELSDRNLVNMILSYHLEPSTERLNVIMAHLEKPLQAKRRVVVGRFAA